MCTCCHDCHSTGAIFLAWYCMFCARFLMAFLTSSVFLSYSFNIRRGQFASDAAVADRRAAAALIRHSSSKWTWLKLPWSQTKANKYICSEIKNLRLIWSGYECEMPPSGRGKGSTPTGTINNQCLSAYHTNTKCAHCTRTPNTAFIYMKIHFSLILIDVDGFVTTLLLLFVISSFIRCLNPWQTIQKYQWVQAGTQNQERAVSTIWRFNAFSCLFIFILFGVTFGPFYLLAFFAAFCIALHVYVSCAYTFFALASVLFA